MAVNPAYVKDVSLGHGLVERDAVPAGGGSSLPLPGVSGIMPVSTTTGTRGASLEVQTEAGGESPVRGIRLTKPGPR